MRKSFPDVQWKLVDMVAEEKTVAVETWLKDLASKKQIADSNL